MIKVKPLSIVAAIPLLNVLYVGNAMIELQHLRGGSTAGAPFLSLGFRPFFLGASVFAVVTISAWTVAYTLSMAPPMRSLSLFQWHAHELIYGYSAAVIAGFLLTAVKNWTGVQTAHGPLLLGLFCLWAAARVSMLFGTLLIHAAALFDILFVVALIGAVGAPILRARKWAQAGVLAKLALLGAGSVSFYAGALGFLDAGVYWGIYGGLYLVIGLVLTIGRRVIPFFIERGVGYPVSLFNARAIDVSSLILFLALFVVELFIPDKSVVPWLAAALFAVNAVRLAGWYTHGIFSNPLLWSLYLAYGFIVAGFLLLALSGFAGVSRFAAIHAFAFGGIGIVTMSMMVRVSLGHTGRDVNRPPRRAGAALAVLSAGAVVRVLCPVVLPQYYLAWIGISQLLWILGFAIVVALLFPVLTAPRVDGQLG